jgi:omega-hydroxy-beta-dihydromenaquinone-9 sulfotransferase
MKKRTTGDETKMVHVDIFDINPLDVSYEPLAGSTFTNLLKLLGQNRFKVTPMGFPRAVYATTLSLILSPLNTIERVKFDKHIHKTNIDKPPIFILGHWRSGTTYIHNLFSQDPQFGFPTTIQVTVPSLFLGFEKLVRPIVESSLPEKRPQDDVDFAADFPQEEEYALGNLSPYSFYNGWLFPSNMGLYNNYVDFQNIPEKEINDFKKIFMYYARKITLYYKGKQLVFKNPSNTARVKLLLELFPNAKFIHIYRNPYHVYLSMKRNIEKEMTLQCLQKPPSWEIFETAMIDMYNRMHVKYFKEKELIPKENLIEVRYEDFLKTPLLFMEKFYSSFNINGFNVIRPTFEKYIESQKKIRIASYKIDDTLKRRIYAALKNTIDLWNYSI